MKLIYRLLLQNKAWAKGKTEIDPEYFESMSKTQNPEILWIGCSDSRVPPDEVINSSPGTLFVHRNIANLVYENDENLMSVIEYAVKYLKVNYVIVCGHYNCGGVRAAMEGIDNERLSQWTRMISEIKKNSPEIGEVNQMVEASVQMQVKKLKALPIIQESWAQRSGPIICGWVYDLQSGRIKVVSDPEGPKEISALS